ncbi:MAG: NADH:ubiquinone reductase (Na(+)-transporting) subunit F [Planctomycetota bacterium]
MDSSMIFLAQTDYTTMFLGVGMFTGVVIALVFVLLAAKRALVAAGNVSITVNGDESKRISVPAGASLLTALAEQKLFIPSACGGGGTCGQCKLKITEGGGEMLPTEATHVSRGEAKEHVRLSCQVKVKQDMKIEVPEEIFSIQKFDCEVISNENVATFIKELVLRLPDGMTLDFESGGYIQIDIPEHDIKFSEFDVEEEYRGDWDTFKFWDLRSVNKEPIFRAYSMANYPAEGNIVMLNVRIAGPPPRTTGIPPGIGSSYIFNLKPGDTATLSGPYGEFFIKETEREMCYIGGGAGMAPMRSHLMHLFRTVKTGRKVTFWYGARSKREMFYVEDFDAIQREYPNFEWHCALSDALPEDNWTGPTGFIHQVAHDMYLSKHEAPEEIEYYMCGPPMLITAVKGMCHELGVEPEMIAFDEF